MARQDYLLKQTRDFGRFLAYLLGLAKKGELAEANQAVDQALQADFALENDFSEKDLKKLLAEGKIQIADLRTIGELLLKKAEFSPTSANRFLQKSLVVFETYARHSPIFDYAIDLKIKTLRQREKAV